MCSFAGHVAKDVALLWVAEPDTALPSRFEGGPWSLTIGTRVVFGQHVSGK